MAGENLLYGAIYPIEQTMNNRKSRLAPSPTGALHIGNARTFLINWALARKLGWGLVMRMEDLDGPRIKKESAEDAIDILTWLGIDFDGKILYQSHNFEPYRDAMRVLQQQGLIYQCRLSRKEVKEAAAAPHLGQHEIRYSPELRPSDRKAFVFDDEQTNYRFLVKDQAISISDEFAGQAEFLPFDEVGDFVVWTKSGTPAYQLAVVVDDARQGVTDVVRGDDLFSSAARQELLYKALGLTAPRWWHLPLVIGEDGRRLAKRHGDTRLVTYKKQGVSAQRLVGVLALLSGICETPEEMSAKQFLDAFVLDKLSHEPVVFSEELHKWLVNAK